MARQQLSTHAFLQEFENQHGRLSLYAKSNDDIWAAYQSMLNFELNTSADKRTRDVARKNLSCRTRFYDEVDKRRRVFDVTLKNADTVQLASNVIELQTMTFDYLSNEAMIGNSSKPHAPRFTKDCTPVRRGSVQQIIENVDECDKEDMDYIPVSSPSSESSEDTESLIDSHNKEVIECSALDFLDSFLRSRVKSADMPLKSGTTIEAVFEHICRHNHGDGKERAEFSWILNVDDPFSMTGFSDVDQADVRNIWKARRSSVRYFTANGWSTLNDDYAKCQDELDSVEKMVNQGLRCKQIYKAISLLPVLRAGEELDEVPIVKGLRKAIALIFELWSKGCSVESEAEYFRRIWDILFWIEPDGIRTTATETTMKPSKLRKLNTEDRANVRGRQSDVSWQSVTGVTLCWGEGKPGDSTDNRLEAESAILKTLKGAKDCIDSIITEQGHNVEMFSITVLGTEWKLYSSVKLPSGLVLCGVVCCHRFPIHFQGFPRLLQMLKDYIAFLAAMEETCRAVHQPCLMNAIETTTLLQTMTYTTPKKLNKL
ncbi:hypothetical protein BJ741DRAFT_613438 [Chytriomyces cf. hyalinus JEL632]|nr:hypothetical protein BJ741DRAFT_613438 [Chytriomyces cf. hyalinus JEL632]